MKTMGLISAGHARPLKGWLAMPVIFLSEPAAGRRRYRSCRRLVSIRGLPGRVG